MLNALYIEIDAVGVAILVIVLLNQRAATGLSSLQRQFNHMIYAAIAMLIVDAACWNVDGLMFRGAWTLNYIVESFYFFFNLFLPFLWAVYTDTALCSDAKCTRRRVCFLSVPMAVYLIVLLTNYYTGWIFTIDAQNCYHRGNQFIYTFILAYLYLSYASIRALLKATRQKNAGDKRQYFLLAAFIIPPTIGGILQTLYFGLNCIWIGTVVSTVMVYIDMLNRQISTEPLTGLNNRRELDKFLQRETKETNRSTVLALIMIDIDHFKSVNDTYGHAKGDAVLVSTAEVLKDSCKGTSAFLARIGGDEFCVVLPAENVRAVEGLIAEIYRNIEKRNMTQKEALPLSLSVGYSLWNAEIEETPEALYKRADAEMYAVKRAKYGQR